MAVVYALGGALVCRSVPAGIAAGAAFAVGIPASAWLGSLWLGRCAGDRGDYLGAVWQRLLWLLHLPWLVAPFFAGVGLVVGLMDRWAADASGRAYMQVVASGFFLWLFGSVGAFVAWWIRRLRALRAGGYHRLWSAGRWTASTGRAVPEHAGLLGLIAGVGAAVGFAR